MPALKQVALATGVTLDVWEEGPADAPALIFLHGFPESHRAWRHQVAHLSPRFRCIAPDQRGYGGSSRPAAVEDYATPRLAADVFALADALGIAHFTLLGHDWGGLVAWVAAMMDEGAGADRRIERLVIANAPHPVLFQQRLIADPAQRRASQYIRAFRDPAQDGSLARHGLAPLLLREFGKGAFADMPAEERDPLLARWRDPAAAMAMVNWYRASPVLVPPVDAPLAAPDGWEQRTAAPVATPALVLWGMEDGFLLPGNLLGLDDHASDLEIRRIAGCGHFTPWQAPDAVNAALDGFLDDGRA